MKKYGLNELREMFLAFFEEKGHLRLPSFPLTPQNDASLLLIGSGMAPMKPWFTGEQEPPRRRICSCQKCIRTVDIENVGKTSRHGTYFEMLGNFSFGDYFKHDAIVWCWEFLTKRLGMDPNLLYPSVYLDDDEAFNIWVDVVGISPERITKLGKEDNFWDHGSGPCGPCSEVYFDRGIENGCEKPDCAPGCDCDRYVEIWNNVFTQYNNDGAGNFTELKQKNIDTGLGLERLACVCQGVGSLFEVDTIVSIVNKISELSSVSYGKNADSDTSIRIITDHIRSATMMISDGVLPSNEGRGYVLRRLLRRAARHGRLLGIKDAFLYETCGVVIEENKNAYPDLIEKAAFITRVIQAEENSFGKTIDAGTAMLFELIDELKAKDLTMLSGADAFKLYDTYGFPLDLIIDMLSEFDMTVDNKAFDDLMDAQRLRARKAREAQGDSAWEGLDLGLDSTPTMFTGYDSLTEIGTVLAIVTNGEITSSIREGDEGIIVLDKTPFYAEKGGQSADTGDISYDEALFAVTNVQANNGDKYLHYGKMYSGVLSIGDFVSANVNSSRRLAIERAHTATHLLHTVLKSVVGDHVNQAGSLVEPDKFRFDFTHFSALTKDELIDIESKVNDAILDGLEVTATEMPIDDAKKLGAAALFGEKYGDIVRVVSIGADASDNAYSMELCGGTHLENSAKAGAFNISSEFSIASGVRRIEATTGKETLLAFSDARRQLSKLAGMVKAGTIDEISEKFEQNISTFKELRSKLDAAIIKETRGEAEKMLAGSREIGGLKVIAAYLEDTDVDVEKLKQIEDNLRDWETRIVAVLAMSKGDKITIMAACGKEAIAKGIKAGELIKKLTAICGGSGGGKPEFAMGGAGNNPEKLREALLQIEKIIISGLEK
ncbi:MAG: alanine--tRNA ligase [Oscillospiraceae bacterium]|nr:alanine--tRNA ligase [Oscillospiraceae bacterium]